MIEGSGSRERANLLEQQNSEKGESLSEVEGFETLLNRSLRRMEFLFQDFQRECKEASDKIEGVASLTHESLAKIREELGFFDKIGDLAERSEALVRTTIRCIFDIFRSDSGGDFHPGQELQKIRKLPLHERQRALDSFKEKEINYRRGLVHIYLKIVAEIRKNPDISSEEIAVVMEGLEKKYLVNSFVRNRVNNSFEEYQKKHQAIKENRKKYADDEELFTVLFGRKPVGDIRIIVGPVTILVKCGNLQDYALIYSGKFTTTEEVSSEDLKGANRTGGCATPLALQENLQGTIIAEKCVTDLDTESSWSKTVFVHEEQHAIYRFFKEMFRFEEMLEHVYRKPQVNIHDLDRDDHLRLLKYDLLVERKWVEARISDEILAYVQGKTSLSKILAYLLEDSVDKGLYDKHIHEIQPSQNEHAAFLTADEVEKVRKDFIEGRYYKHLYEGVEAVKNLQRSGYDSTEITALLNFEPLARWPKVVKRFLA